MYMYLYSVHLLTIGHHQIADRCTNNQFIDTVLLIARHKIADTGAHVIKTETVYFSANLHSILSRFDW